jgi:uncharacterized membrane protein YfbV (UPF0208 family)
MQIHALYRTTKLSIMLHVQPLLGNVLVNKFPQIHILGKQAVVRLRNNSSNCAFYAVCTKQQQNNEVMQSVCKQRLGKQISA